MRLRLACLLAVLCVGPALTAPAWRVPPAQTSPLALPRLAQPLVLDGNLREWSGAVRVPLRSRECLQYADEPWQGPLDASFEAACAWTPAGICLGGVAVDDDLRNLAPLDTLWKGDCVQFYVDARPLGRLGHPRLAADPPGFFDFIISPPQPQRPVQVSIDEPGETTIEGLTVAARRTPRGFTFELFVPWSGLPGFRPTIGRQLGLQFELDDRDGWGRNDDHRVYLCYNGEGRLAARPETYLRFVLSPARRASPLAVLRVPAYLENGRPVRLAVDTGQADWAAALWHVHSPNGRLVFARQVPAASVPYPWTTARQAATTWTPGRVAVGACRVEVSLLDRRGRLVGRSARYAFSVGDCLSKAAGPLERVDVARLAATDPFRAAAWVAAAACLPKARTALRLGDLPLGQSAFQELTARIHLLEHGRLPADTPWPFGLLTLTADPESQVVLEMPSPAVAYLRFNWGAMPLADALAAADDPGKLATVKGEHLQVSGKPAVLTDGTPPSGLCLSVELAPGRYLRIWGPSRRLACRVAELVIARRPVTPTQVDELRRLLVADVAPRSLGPAPAALFCGDLHSHTICSDGTGSPLGQALLALSAGMDFLAITDHNTLTGAAQTVAALRRARIGFPLIVGEEITTTTAHFNAYPLRSVVPWIGSPEAIVQAAHAQGAVIQWNHPGDESPWSHQHLADIMAGTGLDAWEHIPEHYDEWLATGALPVLTGTSDTHWPGFLGSEQTVVLAARLSGVTVAEAVRRGNVAIVWPDTARYLYGRPAVTDAIWAALAEGTALRQAKAARLRAVLQHAHLARLLN